MADYYKTRAEQVYQRLIKGEEIPQQDIRAIYALVEKKLTEDNECRSPDHQYVVNIYNKGNDVFFSLEKGKPISTRSNIPKIENPKNTGDEIEKPEKAATAKKAAPADNLAPTPEEQATSEVDKAERLKALAEGILKKPPAYGDRIPNQEEIEALKYYKTLGKDQERAIRDFTESFAHVHQNDLGNANIDEITLLNRRDYYMDLIKSIEQEEIETKRAQGDNSAVPKPEKERCENFVASYVVRGHHVAAFILDIDDKAVIDSYKRRYPEAFDNASGSRQFNSEGDPIAKESIEQGRSAMESSVKKDWCKP